MRSRSASVYTKRPEIIIAEGPRDSIPSDILNLDLPAPSLKKSYSEDEYEALFEDFGPMIEGKLLSDASDEFTKDSRASLETSCSLAGSQLTYKNSCLSSGFDEIFDEEKTQKLFRGMVIGSRGSGKHSLLKAMFPEDDVEGVGNQRQRFDLMTKTVEKEDSTERYHFWIKETSEENGSFNSLVDVYYKSCTVFFLVYDQDDRASFNKLSKDLERINEVNANKELFFILVGNKRGDKKVREVTSNEIWDLKEKYDIKLSMEINIAKEVPADLRTFIECFLKQN